MSDAIPYLLKTHYFNLLFEVYLRKVPGVNDSHRLSITDIKFNQVMRWVALYDLERSFNHYPGLVIENTVMDTSEVARKLRQVNREVEKAA